MTWTRQQLRLNPLTEPIPQWLIVERRADEMVGYNGEIVIIGWHEPEFTLCEGETTRSITREQAVALVAAYEAKGLMKS